MFDLWLIRNNEWLLLLKNFGEEKLPKLELIKSTPTNAILIVNKKFFMSDKF